jgi:signal transduction histidine kinase
MAQDAKNPGIDKGPLFRSAFVLASILALLALTTAYMLVRLYQTSSLLAESNQKSFLFEAKDKAAILEDYFRQRSQELRLISNDEVFRIYYDGRALGVPVEQGLEMLSGQIEGELLTKRLDIREQGSYIYGSMSFFDMGENKIVARTDHSPRGKWIDESLLEKLARRGEEGTNFGTSCHGSSCRIFAYRPVKHAGTTKGLVLAELATETLSSKIQLVSLQKVNEFSGLMDSEGTLILGPLNLIGHKAQSLFRVSPQDFEVPKSVTSHSQLPQEFGQSLMVVGSKIPDGGFYVIQVAPLEKFVQGHSPFLWTMVLVSLMAALVLVLAHISKSYAERHLMFQKLQEAHDHLELRVRLRTAELENLNETLRLEVSERERAEAALRQASQELEDANRELKEFAYIVSHDLKAPLRGVTQLAGWLAADYEHVLDSEGKESLDLLVGRVKRMHNLIDGILQYSRVGRVREKLKQVNLNQFVPEVIDFVGPPDHIKVTIVDPLPTIECESTRLHEVFQNLLDNAIKYMDKPQGEIRITCLNENSHWRFGVSDNGPGIDQRHFGKIFQIFQTLVPRDEVESTGIGLALVKKIVELHGGKIWVESQLGAGSTFYFTMPQNGGTNEGDQTDSAHRR